MKGEVSRATPLRTQPVWVSIIPELCIRLWWVSAFCLDFSCDPVSEHKADLEEEDTREHMWVGLEEV